MQISTHKLWSNEFWIREFRNQQLNCCNHVYQSNILWSISWYHHSNTSKHELCSLWTVVPSSHILAGVWDIAKTTSATKYISQKARKGFIFHSHLSKSRSFQRAHQNFIINLDEIFVVWNAIFFLNTLLWWDDFVLQVFLSIRIEFTCVKLDVQSQESGRNVAFYGVNWNSGRISLLLPWGFNGPWIKKVNTKWLRYFSNLKTSVNLLFLIEGHFGPLSILHGT